MKPTRMLLALTSVAFSLSVVSATAQATTTPPKCIISLSPSATDTLFAIGAGPQVKAVDESSTYPAAAAALAKRHVINGLSPSLEGLLGICASYPAAADLVVLSFNANGIQQKLAAQHIAVLTQSAPATMAGALADIRQLGTVSGHLNAAYGLTATLNTAITRAERSIPAHAASSVSVYYEVSTNPYYSLTSSTFIGSVLASMGVVNIADAAATAADAGYPSLSAEYIIKANPTLIFLAGDATVASVGARPGFRSVSAVTHHNVILLNADVASQWGSRIATLVANLAAGVKRALASK